MPTLKELRAKVKELRSSQKPLTKASADELTAEIEKHERAMKAEAAKAARMGALAKAREAKAAKKAPAGEPKAEPKAKKVVSIPEKEFIAEHKTLVKELKEAKPKVLAKEAVKQEKELAKVEKKPKNA